MKSLRTPATASVLLVVAMATALPGCQKKDDVPAPGPAETAGKQIDQAAAKAGDALNQAAEKAGEGLQKAGRKIQSEAEQAQKNGGK